MYVIIVLHYDAYAGMKQRNTLSFALSYDVENKSYASHLKRHCQRNRTTFPDEPKWRFQFLIILFRRRDI